MTTLELELPTINSLAAVNKYLTEEYYQGISTVEYDVAKVVSYLEILFTFTRNRDLEHYLEKQEYQIGVELTFARHVYNKIQTASLDSGLTDKVDLHVSLWYLESRMTRGFLISWVKKPVDLDAFKRAIAKHIKESVYALSVEVNNGYIEVSTGMYGAYPEETLIEVIRDIFDGSPFDYQMFERYEGTTCLKSLS